MYIAAVFEKYLFDVNRNNIDLTEQYNIDLLIIKT